MRMRNNVKEEEDILERKQENHCNSCHVTRNMQRRKKENENKERLSKKYDSISNKQLRVSAKTRQQQKTKDIQNIEEEKSSRSSNKRNFEMRRKKKINDKHANRLTQKIIKERKKYKRKQLGGLMFSKSTELKKII